MATITPIRIPVCNCDGTIIERVDPAQARRIALARNATVVRKHQTGVRHGRIVRILLSDDGNDDALNPQYGDPRKYTYLFATEAMPMGVHTLRYLHNSTADMYRQSVTDCLKKAA